MRRSGEVYHSERRRRPSRRFTRTAEIEPGFRRPASSRAVPGPIRVGMASSIGEVGWTVIAAIATVGVVAMLRVIGFEYFHAVRRHNLHVAVNRLRIDQKRQLDELQAHQRERERTRVRSLQRPE